MESIDNEVKNTENFNNLPLEQLEFVAIDIETTGLNSEWDEIIQIAGMRFKGEEVVNQFVSLVKPKGKVPKFIEHLTHISPQELKTAPPIKEVLKDFCNFIGDSILVGHNIGFDFNFLNQFIVDNGGFPISNMHWDTAEIGRIYLPFTTDHKLSTLVSFFGIELMNAHQADADALATGKLFNALTNYILNHYGYMLNARLMDLAMQANLKSGLYEYIKWIVRQQRSSALSGKKTVPVVNELNNVIEHIAAGSIKSIPEVFAEDGIFASKFPNFEFRSGQMTMAEEVADAFGKQDFFGGRSRNGSRKILCLSGSGN